jgi:hypothetical protein
MQETTCHIIEPLGGIKATLWLALLVFRAYEVYCSFQENFFRSA